MDSLARFGASSLVATAVDAMSYQLFVLALPSHYVLAAFVAATCGGVVGFALSRQWVFRLESAASDRFAFGIGRQAVLYALTSLLGAAFVATALWAAVGLFGADARFAWFPSKLAAWGLVGFPLQRSLVFRSHG